MDGSGSEIGEEGRDQREDAGAQERDKAGEERHTQVKR